jgi:transcriptional regulator with XRE-family HTH domain
MNFKKKIQKLCKEKGMLQKEVAAKLGITEIAFNAALRHENPQVATLERIANVLGVHVGELFEYEKREEFTAFVDKGGKLYRFNSFLELERSMEL